MTFRLSFALLAALLLGCASVQPAAERRALPVVAWFADYNEVLVGQVRFDAWIQQGHIELSGQVRELRCVGLARLTRETPNVSRPSDCEGVEGMVELQCSDDRRMLARWTSGKVCGAGYGVGRDEQGNAFRLAYGMSEDTAALMAREAGAQLAELPALPPVGEAARAAGVRTGTAFFVSDDGHLVTNRHVVADAKSIQVVLDGSELLAAELVSEDEANDLAVLRIPAIRPVLTVRRKSGLARGQEVFTLGYPLIGLQGREQKATFGRINALTGLQGDERYAQIDVPIQPGNSGGPLLNTSGEVVGVVTAMLSQQAAYEAAGALPQNVNYALKSEIVHEHLRGAIGVRRLREAQMVAPRGFQELVAASQDSVVIVLAE